MQYLHSSGDIAPESAVEGGAYLARDLRAANEDRATLPNLFLAVMAACGAGRQLTCVATSRGPAHPIGRHQLHSFVIPTLVFRSSPEALVSDENY
ncbi:hypothetical protein J6590_010232 [Homalodisca vitripennis]|nr:hypothetical protein J6590_010232 [Homalodisca vitripennis]